MKNIFKSISLLCVVLLFVGNVVKAEEHGKHDKHSFHKHHVAIFNGLTTNYDHNSTDYSLGIDYEYRFSNLLGAGVLAECVFSEPEEYIAGVSLFVHPCKGFKLILAPLLINTEEHGAAAAHGDSHAKHDDKSVTDFAFRIETSYSFHFHNMSVEPTVGYDFGSTEALVYGVMIGFGF